MLQSDYRTNIHYIVLTIQMHRLKKECLLCQLLILILLFLHQQCTGEWMFSSNQYKHYNVHKSMKKRDLSRIFGVEDPELVPAYEIIQAPSNQISTNFVRWRRDTPDTKTIPDIQPIVLNFGVSAFNMLFRFNLTLNRDLFAPNFKIEIKGVNGTKRTTKSRNCHYVGHVNGNKKNIAAISNCKGMSGLFIKDNHDYFIEPVPDYLHTINSVDSHYNSPHIVFRRSLEERNNEPINVADTFWRYWNKNSGQRRTCATDDDPNIRLERSADDVSNIVRADNSEKYIEALVVVDQKMVNYHGEDAATQFALVILNIVANLLRDGSIGSNLIILVVVKLELHTVDVPGLVINHHARNTLDSFGMWASRASDQDDKSDDHYDYAILLTRYNICADDKQPCDALGLTQTGGMCNWPYSASVNEDNGLPLAYTVTHSIGHSLGMNHDGDESSFICPDNAYIMSSTASQEWKDTRNLWSRCSRNYLRQFLKKPQSHCLDDLPVKSRSVDYEKMDNKPGILYDVNKQCEMQFGTGSKICNKNKMEESCHELSCTNPYNSDKCFSSAYPAADGTVCALNKWCYRGKCLDAGDVKTTDGGWSNWSEEFSPCTRSCGGGVQYRVRQCNHPKPSDGGKYCEGEPRMHRLCNTKSCGENIKAHRSIQCLKLNSRLFGERKFEWEFKASKIDACKLGCFITGTQHGYDFGNVEDGTNCDQLDDGVVSDKCINGECVPVGCDAVLGSKAKFDRCGVCNSDGKSCSTGLDRSDIPDTATGGGIVNAMRSLKQMGFDMGSLYGKSALDLFSSKRSGIPGKDEFGWARIKSGCSVSCGGGNEFVTAECRRQDDGSPVHEDRCDKSQKPPTQQYPCKEEACPPVWQTSYWGDCSKTCNSGYKKRNVRCVQKSGAGIEYDVDGSLCIGTRPSDTEGCNKEPCPAEWIAQPFGECSTICGPGVQVRDVLCQKTLKDGSLTNQREGECRKETKPPTEQKCNVHNPCPGDAGCGGIYTDSRGNFTSPGYPNNYPNNMECVHIIQVQEGKAIQLEFKKMDIVAPDDKDCKNDFVKVMDGDCVSRLGESKFCGKTLPPAFISTTNRLCVKFYSDDSQNDEGFVAKYQAIDRPIQNQDMCGGNVTSPAGLLSSPNYPEYYPPNEDCNITIATEDRPIKITFHAFDVGSDDCSNDYVFLSGGDENKKYCGQKLPPTYTAKKNTIAVRFVSTNHAASSKPGFVATYTSGNGQDTTAISRQQIPQKLNEGDDAKQLHEENQVNASNTQSNQTGAREASQSMNEQKKSFIPSKPNASQSKSSVSFITSAHADEIAKDVVAAKSNRIGDTSAQDLAFKNAMRDDTPSWIPEPVDISNQKIRNDAVMKSSIARSKVPKKSSSRVSTSIYEHNLDGRRGSCPKPDELKCIRVLLSYPCNNDYDCRSGFMCCSTSCTYGTKMCTPKVTRHCPLRDPFYSPSIPCSSELDCPSNSPCCLDMTNKRYCRHMITNRWVN